MDFATRFQKVAERFRRINATDVEDAAVELESASAEAAFVLKNAVDAGLVFGVPIEWPDRESGFTTPEDITRFARLWVGFCIVIGRFSTDPTRPLDAIGGGLRPRMVETDQAAVITVFDATRPANNWKLRAEANAAVADWVAEKCGHGTPPNQGKAAHRKRSRGVSGGRKPRPLTMRQTEVVQIVGECKGNVAEAARRLGRDRKTVSETYRAAMKKLGKQVIKMKAGTLLARDRRGQIDVSDTDDKRLR